MRKRLALLATMLAMIAGPVGQARAAAGEARFLRRVAVTAHHTTAIQAAAARHSWSHGLSGPGTSHAPLAHRGRLRTRRPARAGMSPTSAPGVTTIRSVRHPAIALVRRTQKQRDRRTARRPVPLASIPAPTGLAATVVGHTEGSPAGVKLTWANNAPAPPATRLEILRATGAGFTRNVFDIVIGTPAATSFIDTFVAPGTTYYYEIRAENDISSSAWSDYVAITFTGAGRAVRPGCRGHGGRRRRCG